MFIDGLVENTSQLTIGTETHREALYVTGEHPFWVTDKQQWITVDNLGVGAPLTNHQGATLSVRDKVLLTPLQQTYNITVSDNHNYFAGKLDTLVHNCGEEELLAKYPGSTLSADGKVINTVDGKQYYDIGDGDFRDVTRAEGSFKTEPNNAGLDGSDPDSLQAIKQAEADARGAYEKYLKGHDDAFLRTPVSGTEANTNVPTITDNVLPKPIIPAWNAYINMEAHPDDLIVFFRVIFPAFVNVEGCTLLQLKAEGHSEENLIKFIGQAPSREVFEKDFNNFKIYDLFSSAVVSYESSFEQAAALLKRSWEISLAVSFPQKKFVVSLSNTDRDYGPTLSFYTLRKPMESKLIENIEPL